MKSFSQQLLSIITKITRWACEFVFGKMVLALVPAGVMRSQVDGSCGGGCSC